jgi:hypothetical protein
MLVKKIRMFGFAAAVAGAVAMSGLDASADGPVTIDTFSTMPNPCGAVPESLAGPVSAHFLIQVQKNFVKVQRTFHGRLDGSLGNEYQVNSKGEARFDAPQSSYVLEFENKVHGLAGAPSFTLLGTLTVFVDANQNFAGFNAAGHTLTCH